MNINRIQPAEKDEPYELSMRYNAVRCWKGKKYVATSQNYSLLIYEVGLSNPDLAKAIEENHVWEQANH